MTEEKRNIVQFQTFDMKNDPQAVSKFFYQYKNAKFISQVSLGDGLISVAYSVMPNEWADIEEEEERNKHASLQSYKNAIQAEKGASNVSQDTKYRLKAVSIWAILIGLIGLVEKSNSGFLFIAAGVLAIVYLFFDNRKGKEKSNKKKVKKIRKRKKEEEVDEDESEEMDQ